MIFGKIKANNNGSGIGRAKDNASRLYLGFHEHPILEFWREVLNSNEKKKRETGVFLVVESHRRGVNESDRMRL